MQRILTTCPTTKAPTSTVSKIVYTGPGSSPSASTTTKAPTPSKSTTSSSSTVVHAGLVLLHRGRDRPDRRRDRGDLPHLADGHPAPLAVRGLSRAAAAR